MGALSMAYLLAEQLLTYDNDVCFQITREYNFHDQSMLLSILFLNISFAFPKLQQQQLIHI